MSPGCDLQIPRKALLGLRFGQSPLSLIKDYLQKIGT